LGLPLYCSTSQLSSGNSGIATHFILPLLGLRANVQTPIILDCGEQMRQRPIDSLVQALNKLGMRLTYLNQTKCLPVKIEGELLGGMAEVEGITSQYLSALLIALPCARLNSQITVKNLQERPYVDMTLAWLKKQHINYTHEMQGDRDVFFIPGNQRYHAFTTTISADFSSASYLIAAAVLTKSEVEVQSIDMDDHQGDKKLISILQDMGAAIEISPNKIFIKGGKPLKGIDINACDIPDLIPTLAVIGTYSEGYMKIINVKHAKIKETDRIHSMCEGLTHMGARIEELPDGLIIHKSQLHGEYVKGYGDHRTIMALAIAGILGKGVTTIDDSESVKKTFPTFVTCMQSLGANMEVEHSNA
jgi:3-phosphoshikimate 1-carboxyvinyltransferase